MRYNPEFDHIEALLDTLCFDAFGKNDLDTRASRELSSALKIKRAVSKQMAVALGGEYYMDVMLANTSSLDGIYYFITGMADGVIKSDNGYTLVEICIVNKYGAMLVGEAFFRARMNCLGYFLCRQKEVDRVRLCKSTYNTETGETEVAYEDATVEYLRDIYYNLLSRVHRRGRFIAESRRERIPMLADAVFPYRELRESQAEMIKECYRDIKHKNRLFCQAPTGIGKTVSTIYPSVKCIGENVASKIFYLTSKASIRREALSCVKNMREHGAGLYTCVLTAKEQACACEGARLSGKKLSSYCRPDICPYAKGYYKRSEDAIFELIEGGHEFDRYDIKRIAQKHMVCPHELSLDLSELCDIIICDYNYVFSPTVYLKRYFSSTECDEKYIFLVDEAHNLPDRARDLFSARLCSQDFLDVLNVLEPNNPLISMTDDILIALEAIGRLCEDNSRYDAHGKKSGYYISRQLPSGLSERLSEYLKKCERWLYYNEDSPVYGQVENLVSLMREYRVAEEHFGDNYLVFINRVESRVEILLYCLDPSPQLDASLSRAEASVLFLATLTPAEYFADILGGGRSAVSVSFPSPFDSKNLCVAAVDSISTRYEDRERSYSKIASCIAATVSAKAGNYIVFLPSYSYMDEVVKKFKEKYPKVRTIVQKKGMSYPDREAFLSFFEDDHKLRVGFCVIGGSFSEGIDLPGDRLIGVVVVGVGLPGISNERNIIRDYYEERCGAGYDYSYTYPGMNSVLQAVGRVIRRHEDKGIAVLIDDRFAEPKYKNLFPKEWKNIKYAGNPRSLAEIARIFWEKQD